MATRTQAYNRKLKAATAVRKLCKHFGDKLKSDKQHPYDFGHGWLVVYGEGARKMQTPAGVVALTDGGSKRYATLQQVCFAYATMCGMPKVTPKGQPWKSDVWAAEIIGKTTPVEGVKPKATRRSKKKS